MNVLAPRWARGRLLCFRGRGAHEELGFRSLGHYAVSSRPKRLDRRRDRELILGWSRKVPALLRDIDRYGNTFEIDIVCTTPLRRRIRRPESP
jgi:hypothetical protein